MAAFINSIGPSLLNFSFNILKTSGLLIAAANSCPNAVNLSGFIGHT
jgi:hypothetical protein